MDKLVTLEHTEDSGNWYATRASARVCGVSPKLRVKNRLPSNPSLRSPLGKRRQSIVDATHLDQLDGGRLGLRHPKQHLSPL